MFKPGTVIENNMGQRGVVRKAWTTVNGTNAYIVRFPGGESVILNAEKGYRAV